MVRFRTTLHSELHAIPWCICSQTLKRLGGGGASGARKWQKKKAGAEANAAPRDTEGIATVTDAADKLLQSGYHGALMCGSPFLHCLAWMRLAVRSLVIGVAYGRAFFVSVS